MKQKDLFAKKCLEIILQKLFLVCSIFKKDENNLKFIAFFFLKQDFVQKKLI